MIPLIYVFFLLVSTKLKVSQDNNKFLKKKREIEKNCVVSIQVQ